MLKSTKKSAKKSFLSFDKFITGIIIGGAAASIFGLSKSPRGRTMLRKAPQVSGNFIKSSIRTFGSISVRFLNIFTKNK